MRISDWSSDVCSSDLKGRRVAVAIGGYERQAEGREVVGFGQGAVDPGGKWAWSASLPAIDGGRTDRLFHPGPVLREAAPWSVVGGRAAGKLGGASVWETVGQ